MKKLVIAVLVFLFVLLGVSGRVFAANPDCKKAGDRYHWANNSQDHNFYSDSDCTILYVGDNDPATPVPTDDNNPAVTVTPALVNPSIGTGVGRGYSCLLAYNVLLEKPQNERASRYYANRCWAWWHTARELPAPNLLPGFLP